MNKDTQDELIRSGFSIIAQYIVGICKVAGGLAVIAQDREDIMSYLKRMNIHFSDLINIMNEVEGALKGPSLPSTTAVMEEVDPNEVN
jgi:hypothetical protein